MAGHAALVLNTVLYPTIGDACSVNQDGEGFGGGNASVDPDFSGP